jgi:uncharacterized protein YjbJ (UPF0337 family)
LSISVVSPSTEEKSDMDKDRIKGAAHQMKGAVKEKAGKVTGDTKLEGEGKAEKVAGKVQNTVGGAKDALRGKD